MSMTYNPRDVQEASFEDSAVKVPTPESRPAGRRKSPLTPAGIFMTALAIVGSLAMLVPLYMMVAISLKSDADLNGSPWIFPIHPHWHNFVRAWTIEGTAGVTFANFFQNTITIAVLTTIGTTFSSAFVAFGFARLRFPGRDRLFLLLLSTMMLPSIITLTPSFIGYRYLHWIDTLYPLIIPSFFGGAFNVFLLRQFFMTIPRDLDEAARLDGASYFQIFYKVLLPLTKPALVTVALFAFIYAWKDLIAPLIFLVSPEHQTLELGLRTFQTLRGTYWNLLMAGSVIVLFPLLALFFLGQRYFIKGIAMQGLKD